MTGRPPRRTGTGGKAPPKPRGVKPPERPAAKGTRTPLGPEARDPRKRSPRKAPGGGSARPAAPLAPTVVKTPKDARETMRLQRFLARAGVTSRRQAETMITEGQVTVNGVVATLGSSVDPLQDVVVVGGNRVKMADTVTWLVLNKPAGVVTTRTDPEGRDTVFDLVPNVAGLTYVGRLDYMTEGVLVMTSDGRAAHLLTHPSREVTRTYEAVVQGAAMAALDALQAGVELDDGMVYVDAAHVDKLGRSRWLLTLTLHEGRNREVRRLCEAVGLTVDKLTRVKFGPVGLGDLPPGQWRPLSPTELRGLAIRGGVEK
ncbi:MAG: pseudouridine synthase [Gemmatimonadota bacterium]